MFWFFWFFWFSAGFFGSGPCAFTFTRSPRTLTHGELAGFQIQDFLKKLIPARIDLRQVAHRVSNQWFSQESYSDRETCGRPTRKLAGDQPEHWRATNPKTGAPGASRRVTSGCAGQRVGGLVGCAGLTGMQCRAGASLARIGNQRESQPHWKSARNAVLAS